MTVLEIYRSQLKKARDRGDFISSHHLAELIAIQEKKEVVA